MNFEQNIVFQFLSQTKKKIHYESQLLDEHSVLDISADTDLVMLNHSFSSNHTHQQYELLKHKVGSKDFVLLTSNYYFWKNKHPNIVYFPYYYFYFLSLPIRSYNILDSRPYPLMCLNLNPWLHRTLNFLKMTKKTWFNKCKLSFHWIYQLPNYNTTNIGLSTLAQLNEEQKILLDSYKFPILADDDSWEMFSHYYVSNQGNLYEKTYINYITENNVAQELITEKTWKPIFSGQLFYVLGPLHIIQHLRDIGIDVFDDIINHEYDKQNMLEDKIDSILNDLDRLLTMDLDKIWKDTAERRKKNFDLVYSQNFKNLLLKDLLTKTN